MLKCSGFEMTAKNSARKKLLQSIRIEAQTGDQVNPVKLLFRGKIRMSARWPRSKDRKHLIRLRSYVYSNARQ